MSHRLEGILALARTYQLPVWAYSPHAQLDPYLLASAGFRPTARHVIECHICLKRIDLTQELRANPESLLPLLKLHEENCIYANEQPVLPSKEELYLAIDDISAEIDLNKSSTSSFPLIDRKSLISFAGPNVFLLRKVLSLYDMSLQDFKITFVLRIFGWYISQQEDGTECINCHFCGRSRAIAKLSTSSTDRQIGDVQGEFNVAGQHRYFCLISGQQEGWLLLLQDYEDKFTEAVSFKTKPLQGERMRLRIDKFIETTKEKIESGLSKLKTLTHQCGILCAQLGEDPILGLSADDHENELKRFREHEQGLQVVGESIGRELNHPLKKIRFN